MSSALETRVNSSVMERLTNAQGVLANGKSITVIFDRAFVEGMSGQIQIDASSPMVHAYDADVAANSIGFGTAVSINGVPLKVKSFHPDGTGLTLLILEAA
ncbi:hypothetical protein ACFPOE_11380 [Caenimonas terrae]|uniref:Uncharacterized protein n=1 Tax=Caenimonas terrae TaxID=696074 RepID=A0ABW0NE23_9BURK